MKFHSTLIAFILPFLGSQSVFAYSETGHRVIGSVADKLVEGKPAGEAIKKLLGSVTLERASTLPDELRGEDRAAGTFQLPENPALQEELLAFRTLNSPTDDLTRPQPSHHWFHYTDVPLQSSSYSATKKGTSKWDVVQMITFCTRVLQGKEKPENALKITPGVAVVLLAHMVGDIHQPMHVGGVFLNPKGERLDPNSNANALESRGGNDLNFGGTNLHAYWDYDAVESCMAFRRRLLAKRSDQYLSGDLAAEMATKEPPDWKLDPAIPLEKWSEKWADEILPLAREAHDRLKFLPQENFDNRKGKPTLRWTVIEAPHNGKDSYAVFASKTAEKQLPKAGWRLAAILEASLIPASN